MNKQLKKMEQLVNYDKRKTKASLKMLLKYNWKEVLNF
jgi:hypothetical protein